MLIELLQGYKTEHHQEWCSAKSEFLSFMTCSALFSCFDCFSGKSVGSALGIGIFDLFKVYWITNNDHATHSDTSVWNTFLRPRHLFNCSTPSIRCFTWGARLILLVWRQILIVGPFQFCVPCNSGDLSRVDHTDALYHQAQEEVTADQGIPVPRQSNQDLQMGVYEPEKNFGVDLSTFCED